MSTDGTVTKASEPINNRRSEDKRMDRLEKQITTIADSVHKIEIKIYDGYDKSIKNTAINVERIDRENQAEHKELKDKLDKLSDQMTTMLWKLVGMTTFLVIGSVIAHALHWI